MAMNWYCLQLVANRDKSLVEALDAVMKSKDSMAGKFGEVLVPTEEVVELKRGKRKVSKRKFFPGYVFIEMDMTPETWHEVKRLPMIRGFVGDADSGRKEWNPPEPMSDDEINEIRSHIAAGAEKPRPKVEFEVGEAVRIKEGPFTNFNGNVKDVNYETSRISVSVNVFNRPTDIQLDFEQVEKM